MQEPLRVSIVSYLNSTPFLHGLAQSPLSEQLLISKDTPAVCSEKMLLGQADIGLIPVATLKKIPTAAIFSNYCIGCDGAVSSVLLLSEVPLNSITAIVLDYQSRTSVQLVKVLASNHWNITPEWRNGIPGYESEISGTQAAVVIGDRALAMKNEFEYVYDLGEEWKSMTGLPFVFAVWVATKKLETSMISEFNLAFKNGIDSIPDFCHSLVRPGLNDQTIRVYLQHYIQFEFGELQRKGLDLFQSYLRHLSLD